MWSPIISACLSGPIVINAGETYETTLSVWAGDPNSNVGPQFEDSNPAGIYRIVWNSAYSTYNPNEYPFGTQLSLEERVSNRFYIE